MSDRGLMVVALIGLVAAVACRYLHKDFLSGVGTGIAIGCVVLRLMRRNR